VTTNIHIPSEIRTYDIGVRADVTNLLVAESTMGVSVKAQSDGRTEYVNAVSRWENTVLMPLHIYKCKNGKVVPVLN
jgi:hypothetical protein